MKFEKLFEPITFGALTAKNRIESAPSMTNIATKTGEVTRELLEYYRRKAMGGAGIVTVGESAIDREYSIAHPGSLILDTDRVIPGLSELAEAIKRYGALASIELAHAGRQSIPWLIDGKNPIGPSPLSSDFHEKLSGQKIVVEEMDQEMIDHVAENFADACLRAKRAGFDMVLIHGGHGWLLAQFLSPFTNKRTDRYGGSLENRARFPLQVLTRIREKCGYNFGIEYRMSALEFIEGGLTQEEGIAFAKLIQDKVDLLNVSVGMIGNIPEFPLIHPVTYEPHGRNVPYAAAIKKEVKIPVTCLGAINDPYLMESILREGKADIIGTVRTILADPFFPDKVRHGRTDDYTPCTRCLYCLSRSANFYPIKCAVNPVIGREMEFAEIKKAARKKKVVIVGGGPAGMKAAEMASERGHAVTLFEKENRLGGNLILAAAKPFKKDTKKYLDFLIRNTCKLPVKIRLSTEATVEIIREEKPDVLILAVGAEPFVPNIPGTERKNAILASDLLDNKAFVIGEKVVVAGGGLVGCEVALALAMEGKKVTIVEMQDDVAKDAYFVPRIALIDLLAKENVEIKTNLKVVEINEGGVKAADNGGNLVSIDANTVVMAFGYQARTAEVDKFKDLVTDVIVVGDCKSPRRIADAIREGFFAGVDL